MKLFQFMSSISHLLQSGKLDAMLYVIDVMLTAIGKWEDAMFYLPFLYRNGYKNMSDLVLAFQQSCIVFKNAVPTKTLIISKKVIKAENFERCICVHCSLSDHIKISGRSFVKLSLSKLKAINSHPYYLLAHECWTVWNHLLLTTQSLGGRCIEWRGKYRLLCKGIWWHASW